MIGQRDKLPDEALPDVETQRINSRKWQIRFNFKEIAATDITPVGLEYDYVNVTETTKKAVKMAIIRTEYDHDDEIALINEKDIKPDKYKTYSDLRALADVIFSKMTV